MNLWHAQPVAQHLCGKGHHLLGQFFQSPHQAGDADGLDLLEMKFSAFFDVPRARAPKPPVSDARG